MNVRELEQSKVQKSLQGIVNDAELFDQEFIELRYLVDGIDNEKILGFDAITIIKTRARGQTFVSPTDYAYIKDGCVYFYPDKQARRWGYVSDTPKNRFLLAAIYKNRTVKIMDKQINKEVMDLCAKHGFPTEMIVVDHTFDNYLSRGKENKKDIEQTNEIEELQAKLAKAKAAIKPEVDFDILEHNRREADLAKREADMAAREKALEATPPIAPKPISAPIVEPVVPTVVQEVAPKVVKVTKKSKKSTGKKPKKGK